MQTPLHDKNHPFISFNVITGIECQSDTQYMAHNVWAECEVFLVLNLVVQIVTTLL
jgi:hypothetical protein